MLASDVLGYASDVEKAQRRMDALEALLRMRSKQLQESLKERIKRAHTHGEWIQLSSEECAGLHEQEKLYHKSQFVTLQHELTRTIRQLATLKQAKKRARLIRAVEMASELKKKRH
ncbi:MAG TPA: hypothetical protein VJU54_10250 [Nitrospiraceae bacterium]|nr:hypothetical protein [Nitrospiraceae bacterium]